MLITLIVVQLVGALSEKLVVALGMEPSDKQGVCTPKRVGVTRAETEDHHTRTRACYDISRIEFPRITQLSLLICDAYICSQNCLPFLGCVGVLESESAATTSKGTSNTFLHVKEYHRSQFLALLVVQIEYR